MSRVRQAIGIAGLLLGCGAMSAGKEPALHVVVLIGEDEYATARTLPAFVERELRPRGLVVTIINADPQEKNSFPGLTEALPKADLLLLSVRRRTPPAATLAAVRAYLAAGKPLVGIRTASHAFEPRPEQEVPTGGDRWDRFDVEVLGIDYLGHYGHTLPDGATETIVTRNEDQAAHPILAGFPTGEQGFPSWLYKSTQLSGDATLLLEGRVAISGEREPLAWTRLYQGGRVFYTSLGLESEFEMPAFRRLLLQAIYWALDREVSMAANSPSDETVAQYAERSMVLPARDGVPEVRRAYRLLTPKNIEADETYPLVVFLHGLGERGIDNRLQLKYLPEWLTQVPRRERFVGFVLAPQCPADRLWTPHEGMPKIFNKTDELPWVERMIERELAEQPIDRRRVYLTGLSMGGFGSWELAARHPEWFAAVAPICGRGNPAAAERLKCLPIWAFHGAADPIVKPKLSQEMVEAIRAAGGDVRYTELPGVGHDSWTPAYIGSSDLLEWMFAQRRGE